MIWTSNIIHPARKILEISMNEYALADLIYHLSNNRKHRIKNWCTASRPQMAETFDLSKKTIISLIQKLESKGLVERHDNGQFLRTTGKWYDNVIMYKQGGEESSPLSKKGVKKVHPRGEESSPLKVKKVHPKGEESSPNKYNSNINSNTDNEYRENHAHKNRESSDSSLNASQNAKDIPGDQCLNIESVLMGKLMQYEEENNEVIKRKIPLSINLADFYDYAITCYMSTNIDKLPDRQAQAKVRTQSSRTIGNWVKKQVISGWIIEGLKPKKQDNGKSILEQKQDFTQRAWEIATGQRKI